MFTLLEMDTATRVQNLEEAVCISYCTNTLMHPTILLPPAMSKQSGRRGYLALVTQSV